MCIIINELCLLYHSCPLLLSRQNLFFIPYLSRSTRMSLSCACRQLKESKAASRQTDEHKTSCSNRDCHEHDGPQILNCQKMYSLLGADCTCPVSVPLLDPSRFLCAYPGGSANPR
ncbi:unnamed protein product [Amoebophrya sp. A25]|nr:unnamed protein product [Amoebophrya sp. A25]|eukprot:GSA25T00001038001.1